MTRLSVVADGALSAETGRTAAPPAAASADSAHAASPGIGLTLGVPVLGVTATFSPQSLQALAGAAADAVTGVADVVANASEQVGDLAGAMASDLRRSGADVLGGASRAAARLAQGVEAGLDAGAGLVADGAGAVASGVGSVAGGVAGGVLDVGGEVLGVAAQVAGYGVLAALVGGAVLDELA